MRSYLIILFALLFINAKGIQTSEKDTTRPVIQFSGVVLTGDSLTPIPFAFIRVEGYHFVMSADAQGFFSFAARPGTTVIFSAVGFKSSKFKIPDTLKSHKYSWIQMMQNDTILLTETVIYSWANVEQLEKAIIEYRVPEGDFERAVKNLAKEEMKERALNLPMDGSMTYRQAVQNITSKNYYNGQFMPNNLLNPIAWAKFFEAWKNGDFKKKTN